MDAISTAVTAERFDKFAAQGLADDATDRKEDLRLGIQHILWALGHLRDAGVSDDYLADLAACAHDAATKRDEVLNRDLDAAGYWADPVDLTDLDTLLGVILGRIA
jgi:predicted hydrolase (HD superfamily)